MKNRKKIIIGLIVVLAVLFWFSVPGLIRWLFSEQYNENGISHFLVITIDEAQSREYIGRLDDHDIYLERLDPENTVFRSVEAENVSLKDAFENDLVSIDDWRKYALKIKKEGDTVILQFDNYEIAVGRDDCIIRPLSRF